MALIITLVVLSLACTIHARTYPHGSSPDKTTTIDFIQTKAIFVPGKGIVSLDELIVHGNVFGPHVTASNIELLARLANNKVIAAKSREGGLSNYVTSEEDGLRPVLAMNQTMFLSMGPKPQTKAVIYVDYKQNKASGDSLNQY